MLCSRGSGLRMLVMVSTSLTALAQSMSAVGAWAMANGNAQQTGNVSLSTTPTPRKCPKLLLWFHSSMLVLPSQAVLLFRLLFPGLANTSTFMTTAGTIAWQNPQFSYSPGTIHAI
jgi:hypothetical protein